MDDKAAIVGNLPDFILHEIAERKQRFRERLGADGMQKVALILVAILALEERAAAIDDAAAGIVAGCQQVAAESPGVITVNAELDFAVAQHVGVGSATPAVLVEEILEHLVAVLP